MCNIFTGWLHRKIKTDVFSESRNFRLWNRTSRLPILMMGTCLEELMEFSISLAETAWEKMGQWGHESSLSALSCLVPYLLLKQRVGRKVPNMIQFLFTSLEGVHEATLSVCISIPCMAVSAFHGFRVISGCWDGIGYEAEHSVFIIYCPDTTLSEIWYVLNIMLLEDFILTAEANCFT